MVGCGNCRKKYQNNKDVINLLAKRTIIATHRQHKIGIEYKGTETRSNIITYLNEDEEEIKLKDKQHREEIRERIEEKRDTEFKPYLDAIMNLLEGDVKKSIPEMQEASKKLSELTTQVLSAKLNKLVDQGVIEKIEEKKRAYFCLSGTAERLKAKEERMRQKQLEETRNYNEGIRKKIKRLEQEKEGQENVVIENSKKLFGSGAKAKKDAQNRIEMIEKEINELKQKIKS